MADKKNTQTAVAGLPKKAWHRLPDVLAHLGYSVDDLLHNAETSKLFLCAYLENIPPANWLQGLPARIDRSTLIKNMEEGAEDEEHTKEFRMNAAHLCTYRPFHFNEYWKKGIAPASGVLYLLLDVFRVGENVKCKALANPWLLVAEGGLKPEIAGVYYTVMGDAIDMMILDTPVTIPIDEIVLITEEIERFEQAQGIGKPAATTETTPDDAPPNRPWAHLIDSQNPKTGGLYKQDAKRIRASLTPELLRMWAREAVARNNDSRSKAGLELNVTPQRIGQLLK